MTDHEMRIRLAEAMGWTDIQVSKISGQVTGIDPDGNAGTIPNPLDNDRDAARLRAWLIADYWEVRIVASRHDATAIVWREHDHRRHVETVHPATDPDPCCRDRLALCRAAVQALEAIDAGGVA